MLFFTMLFFSTGPAFVWARNQSPPYNPFKGFHISITTNCELVKPELKRHEMKNTATVIDLDLDNFTVEMGGAVQNWEMY